MPMVIFTKKTRLKAIQAISGLIIILISILALVGWLFDLPVFSSFKKEFIPMAPLTALIFILYGLFLAFEENLVSEVQKKIVVIFISILSVYCVLHFIAYFLKIGRTFDLFLFPSVERLKKFPVYKMSPYSGLLFFFVGIAILLKLKCKNKDSILKIVAGIGLVILLAAFVACLGYLFGTPFLYSGNIIPIAATTAIAFFSLGYGLILLSGEKTLPLSYFVGQTANARILRAILPIVVIGLIVEGLLNVTFVRNFEINAALFVALLTLFMVVLTFIIVIRVSQVVFKQANEAESERKHAENELLKFKLGIERSNELIFMTDIEGNITYVNPSFEKVYGYKEEDVLGRNPRFLKSGIQPDSFYREFWDTLLNKQLVVKEIVNKTNDGIFLNIDTSVNPILDESKNIIGFLAVQHDITQRKQSELRLLDYSEKLKISNDTKDKFFSIIAHDLKSPFNAILGFSQILNDEYDSYNDKQKKSIIQKIKYSSENAFNLLENLLIWSRTQTKGIKVKPIVLDLVDIIKSQTAIIANIADSKNIKIKYNIPETAFVYTDKDMVKTVILNLLNNAIKFTSSEGNIIITLTDKEDKIELSVADSGVGISRDNQEKLFRISHTLSTDGTMGEKGTGLGLLICKEFVEMNGGDIRVESEEGKGSNFYFTLPKTTNIN
jgi:PAS domain S-box-containing protein